MSPSAVSLMMIFPMIGAGVVIGFLAGVRRKMNLEQWVVALCLNFLIAAAVSLLAPATAKIFQLVRAT